MSRNEMKEFDLQRIKTASIYLERMADGRNPATNQQVKDEILDNPNVIRCLHFVCEILREVELNGGVVGKKRSKARMPFPLEALDQFVYRNDKPITHILKQFAEPVDGKNVRKLNTSRINKWLEANGYIEKRIMEESKRECWFPLEKGEKIGMYSEERGNQGYQYAVIMYSEKAQYFLVEHMKQILEETEGEKKKEAADS